MTKRRRVQLMVTARFTALLCVAGIALLITSCNRPYDKGPVNDAVLRTLARGGPVKDDLIARGPVIRSSVDSSGTVVTGRIKVSEIEKLVEAGVYLIDKEGYLTFGPYYSPPTPTISVD